MSYETQFLIALLGTEIIEIPVVLIFIRYVFRIKKIKSSQIMIVAFLATLVTLPYLWFVLPSYVDETYYIYMGEFLVFVFESLIYCYLLRTKLSTSFVISFVANFASYLVGPYIIRLVS